MCSRSKKSTVVPRNHGKAWTAGEILQLNAKAVGGYSAVRAARELGRTVAAVRAMASHHYISFRSTNRKSLTI